MIKAEITEQDKAKSNLIDYTNKQNKINHPKSLEYWRNVFPSKSDFELEEYRVRWSDENPKYLKFKNL